MKGSRRNTSRPLKGTIGSSMERWKGGNTISLRQPTCQSKEKQTRTTQNGKPTTKNVWTFTWEIPSRENDGSFTSGKSKTHFAQSANRKSPRLRDGTAITYTGGLKVVQTRQKTEYSFIPIVINKYTARIYTWRNRVPQGAL